MQLSCGYGRATGPRMVTNAQRVHDLLRIHDGPTVDCGSVHSRLSTLGWIHGCARASDSVARRGELELGRRSP